MSCTIIFRAILNIPNLIIYLKIYWELKSIAKKAFEFPSISLSSVESVSNIKAERVLVNKI